MFSKLIQPKITVRVSGKTADNAGTHHFAEVEGIGSVTFIARAGRIEPGFVFAMADGLQARLLAAVAEAAL